MGRTEAERKLYGAWMRASSSSSSISRVVVEDENGGDDKEGLGIGKEVAAEGRET